MAITNIATPSRRGLLTIAAGASAAASPIGSAPARTAGADAELIRLCAEYVAAVDAYNADGGILELEDDPLWQAIEAVKRRLDGLPARTLAGVVAKARVASYLARQPDGREDFSCSFTGEWPGEVVRDLLRLHRGAAA